MPVTKAVMAPGSFEIGLTADILPVAFSLTDKTRLADYAFGHVLVFPTRLDPDDYADADLLAMSVFTGIYRLQANRTTLRGMHASGWLGDPGDKGAIYETAITGNTTATFQSETKLIHIDRASPVRMSTVYGSVGSPAMAYAIYVTLEQVLA